jgi:tetratricopeptide (TPR) repeat protein
MSLRFLWLVVCASLLAGCHRPPPPDPRIQAPIDLIKEAKDRGAKKIFANPRAQPGLREKDVALAPVNPDDANAVQSGRAWRRLDRKVRFDAVLLAGPAGEYLPLLQHLATSPDFRLVRADNWGVLFVRELAAPYQPPSPDAAAKNLDSPVDRGIYLGQTALTLDAIGQTAAARKFSAAALEAAPNEAGVHVAAAALALSQKDYARAIQESEQAAKLHPHDLGALEIAARTFAAAGATDQAFAVAQELKSHAPADDVNVLFLHARFANAAHAYGAEQESLEQLIRVAEKQKLPTSDYRVYLGQCYAKQGLARPALQQLELASKDPNLSAKQKADLATALETVRARAGNLSP